LLTVLRIALTFDDGPNPVSTPQLLDILAEHQVHATFFMVGKFVEAYPEVARSVALAGHAIGNHTFNHLHLTAVSNGRVLREILHCQQTLTDIVGKHSRLFRAPYGKTNVTITAIAKECGLRQLLWQVDGHDWHSCSAQKIFRSIIQGIAHEGVGVNLAGGAQIISGERSMCLLLHDGCYEKLGCDHSVSLRATELLIKHYKGRAQFVIPTAFAPL
jgi:peptidoglycan-N-acetylglucosamine deacetylase